MLPGFFITMKSDDRNIRILQITDLHLLSRRDSTLLGVDTSRSCEAVLRQALARQQPDLLLLSGDLAQEAVQMTYRRLKSMLGKYYRGDLLILPGNHDMTDPMAETMLATEDFQQGNWAVMGLDTHLDNQIPGHVTEQERTGFLQRLEACDAPYVLVAGHHPLLEVGTAWLDVQRIDNGELMLGNLTSDSRIKAYVFGHIHQHYEGLAGDLKLLGTPSTCFQFAKGADNFTVSQESPGYREIVLTPDGDIETRVQRVKGFDLTIDLSNRHY